MYALQDSVLHRSKSISSSLNLPLPNQSGAICHDCSRQCNSKGYAVGVTHLVQKAIRHSSEAIINDRDKYRYFSTIMKQRSKRQVSGGSNSVWQCLLLRTVRQGCCCRCSFCGLVREAQSARQIIVSFSRFHFASHAGFDRTRSHVSEQSIGCTSTSGTRLSLFGGCQVLAVHGQRNQTTNFPVVSD